MTYQYIRYPGASGGSSGIITSINGNNTPAQLIVAGSGINVSSSGGTTTISNTEAGGSVTSVSVVTANGLAGTVANPSTTPAITLSTTVTGILQGNGTTISAATTGNLTDAGTDGITVTGGTGAVLGSGTSLSQHVADTTHNGYLSSTDWNTFNGKQAAGSYITALTGDVTAAGPGSASATLKSNLKQRSISVAFDGGGAPLTAGKIIYLANIPYSGTITGVQMLADVSGSAVVDIWETTYAGGPPTVANTIVDSFPPTLSSAQKSQDTTLTNWTTSITAGNMMAFKLNSNSTITFLSLVLTVSAS